jgi:hypothetical protein
MRERHGMAPIDDPLPGQADSAYRHIKHLLFPSSPTQEHRLPSSKVATKDVPAATLRGSLVRGSKHE